ncbi:hypothetical protein [Gloeothece verrucosa]|uniref:Uncharacterized protein n=1 Tax=Gloeothece verrucosa (strain PCC 7822) TaxID=497965 RepID=E0UHE2_GLOV7|nr:hypothetical protein [Gloeothece verrucosa]ADN12083.1 hypothetical protein Cyan7822_0031 [Gloeothece verrucosa PCC 7822]
MEMSGLQLFLIILFNAAVCVLLPRLITLNWSQMLTQLNSQQKNKQQSITVQ